MELTCTGSCCEHRTVAEPNEHDFASFKCEGCQQFQIHFTACGQGAVMLREDSKKHFKSNYRTRHKEKCEARDVIGEPTGQPPSKSPPSKSHSGGQSEAHSNDNQLGKRAGPPSKSRSGCMDELDNDINNDVNEVNYGTDDDQPTGRAVHDTRHDKL